MFRLNLKHGKHYTFVVLLHNYASNTVSYVPLRYGVINKEIKKEFNCDTLFKTLLIY